MKTLKKFDFPTTDRTAYDWDAILSGKPVQLDRGTEEAPKDYDCKDATFATLCRNAAKKRGMVIRTAKVEGGMVVQAFPASDEQKAKWAEADAERAAAKEAEGAEETEGGDEAAE